MKFYNRTLFLFCAIFFLIPNAQAQNFPSVNVPFLGNSSEFLDVNKLDSKIVLVNFWASWCGICKQEMNDILTIANHYDEGDVSVVTIATDDQVQDSVKAYEAFGEKHSLANPDTADKNVYWLWDEDKNLSLKSLNILRVPETYFLVKEGQGYRVFDKVVGRYKWNSSKPYKKINTVLNGFKNKKRGE